MEKTHNSLRKQKVLIVEDQFTEAYDLRLILESAGYCVSGIGKSVEEALVLLEKEKPDLVLLDIFLKGKLTGIDLARELQKKGIGFIFISANSGKNILDEAKMTQPYGFIVKPFRENDILTTLEIAFYRLQYSLESNLLHQKELQSQIDSISAQQNWEEALCHLAKIIQTYVPFDFLEAGSNENPFYGIIGLFRRHYEEYQIITPEHLCKLAELSEGDFDKLYSASPLERSLVIIQRDEMIKTCRISAIKRIVTNSFRLKSCLTIPIEIDDWLFNFTLYSKQTDSFENHHLTLFSNIAPTLKDFIKRHFSSNPAMVKKDKAEVSLAGAEPKGFEGMIGSSAKMITVFDYVKRVAPLDISVLILGENGTGKEKVAQSIHNLSKRKPKPFVVVNCGTIPENLAESLLFGHEKGAFTGATEKRSGKFEIAEGGTVFLDEIGEMPLETQVKLLRVLQEKEIDRVGGKFPIKTDVRIIAATNKNLETEVAAGRFRMDLYYRLYVFPITVPALRERKDDIGPLTSFFCRIYSDKLGRKQTQFSNEAVYSMCNYDWPGNIRELEHFVQRNLLLSDDTVIRHIELPVITPENVKLNNNLLSIKTMEENERAYILSILQKCNWKISGAGGAAELLGLHPSTLNSKMKKLSIQKG